jgi:hypothetical protein
MIQATFRLRLHDLDTKIIDKIKSIFANNDIVEISVSNEMDETDYLLSAPANRESLERSLEQFRNKQFITKKLDELGT